MTYFRHVPSSRYTAEAQRIIAEWWGKGATAGYIARELGITRSALIGLAHRMGLPGRPSPIVRDPGKTRTYCRTPREFKPPPVVRTAPDPVPRKFVGQCKWVDGDGRPWVRCEAPIVRGSYCAAHAARAYQARKEAHE